MNAFDPPDASPWISVPNTGAWIERTGDVTFHRSIASVDPGPAPDTITRDLPFTIDLDIALDGDGDFSGVEITEGTVTPIDGASGLVRGIAGADLPPLGGSSFSDPPITESVQAHFFCQQPSDTPDLTSFNVDLDWSADTAGNGSAGAVHVFHLPVDTPPVRRAARDRHPARPRYLRCLPTLAAKRRWHPRHGARRHRRARHRHERRCRHDRGLGNLVRLSRRDGAAGDPQHAHRRRAG